MDAIGAGLPLFLDAVRFHRLRREGAVRILFLVALLAALAPGFVPQGTGIGGATDWIAGILRDAAASGTMAAGGRSAAAAFSLLSEQWGLLVSRFDLLDALWIAASLVSPAVLALVATLYANLYVDDLRGRTDGKPVVRTLRALPRLLLLYVLVQLPFALGSSLVLVSSLLFMLSAALMVLLSSAYTMGLFLAVPGIVLVLALCLSPLLATEAGQRTGPALAGSAKLTKRLKMRLAFLDLTIVLGMNLPSTLLQWPFAAGDTTGLAMGAIGAFFTALTWMMLGRLHGKVYHLLAAPPDVVLPSAKPA